MNIIPISPDESEAPEREIIENAEMGQTFTSIEVEPDRRYMDALKDIHNKIFPEKKSEDIKDFKCDQYAIFDWEAIYSSKKFRFLLFTYLLFIYSSMALAWSSCLYDEVENRPVINIIASAFLLLSSLFFPFTIPALIPDENGHTRSFKIEIYYYRSLATSFVLHLISLILCYFSMIYTLSEKEMYVRSYDYHAREPIRTDVTTFLKVVCCISFAFSLMTFILSFINLVYLHIRLYRYLHRLVRSSYTLNQECISQVGSVNELTYTNIYTHLRRFEATGY